MSLRSVYAVSIVLLSVMVPGFLPDRAEAACAALPTTMGTASFTVSVPAAGMYRFWAHEFSPATNKNGFYLQVDNQYCQITVGDSASIPVGQFTWIDYRDAASSNKINLDLSGGSHTIQLAGIDDGVGIDKIMLVSDLSCVPVGQGDNCETVVTPSGQAPDPNPIVPPTPGAPQTGNANGTPVSGTISLPGSGNGVTRTYYLDGKPVDGSKIDTTKLADGAHTLEVVEKDASGNTKTTKQKLLVSNHRSLWSRFKRIASHPVVTLVLGLILLLCSALVALWHFRQAWVKKWWARIVARLSRNPAPSLAPKSGVVVSSMHEDSRRRQYIRIASIATFAVIGGALTIYSFAASSTVSYLLSGASVAHGAQVVAHSSAIGGKMIQFAAQGSSPAPAPSPSPTPSPAPSPSPTPPPSTAKNCAAAPGACGYPDASNTGWQHTGVTLTVVNQDPYYINTPGAVIDGMDIRGCVYVRAQNVTIKRSKISCANQPIVKTYEPDGNGGLTDLASGLLIEDVEFDGLNDPDSTGVAFNHYTIRRSNFHNIGSAARVGNGTLVEDNYVHDIASTTTSHNGGFPSDGGDGITIRHNTVFMNSQNGYTLSIYNWNPPGNVVQNVIVDNNILAGGNYIIYCGAPGHIAPNLQVTNNRFSRLFYANGGYYGFGANCSGAAVWTNNVWDDSLAPIVP